MTNRQIESSREVRLWIAQILIPALSIAGMALAIPEVRHAVRDKTTEVKESVKRWYESKRSK